MAKKLKKLLLPELRNWPINRDANFATTTYYTDPSVFQKLREETSDETEFLRAVEREALFRGELRINEQLTRQLVEKDQSFERLLVGLDRRMIERLTEIWPTSAMHWSDEHEVAQGILRAIRTVRGLRRGGLRADWLAFQLGRLVAHAIQDDRKTSVRSGAAKKAAKIRRAKRKKDNTEDAQLYQARVNELVSSGYGYVDACEQTAENFRRKYDQKRHHSRRVRELTKNPKRKTRKRTDA